MTIQHTVEQSSFLGRYYISRVSMTNGQRMRALEAGLGEHLGKKITCNALAWCFEMNKGDDVGFCEEFILFCLESAFLRKVGLAIFLHN